MPPIASGKTIIYKSNCNLNPVATLLDLPLVGAENTLYIVKDTAAIYIWDGSEYISNDPYYTNSYVERLKALGSNVQYSNYNSTTVSSTPLPAGFITLNSVFINKKSTISSVSWRQHVKGSYTPSDYNGIGIYSVNSTSGLLTLLGSTTDDGALWSTVTSLNFGNKAFTVPITLQPGVYYIALLYNSSAEVTEPALSRSSTIIDSASKLNYTFLSNNLMLSTKTVSTYNALPATFLSTDFDIGELSDILYWLH